MRSFVTALAMGLAIQPQQAVGVTHLGCFRFEDYGSSSNVGADAILIRKRSTSTRWDCRKRCRRYGYTLAGVQDGTRCYCGYWADYDATRDVLDKVRDSTCSVKCGGDALDSLDSDDITCGGEGYAWLMTVN